MMRFLATEQRELAERIGEMLVARAETVAVAESSTGGLISAALLAVAGASRYYAGGGVLYTLDSRVAMAGVPREDYADYRGTTADLLVSLAEATRRRLDASWCVGESGLAGPTGSRFGAPAGRTTVAVAGPRSRVQVFETGSADREANMVAFTTSALRFLLESLTETPR
ncbi:MAG: CinA family protein [Dehalococcoidia bacterium]